MTKLNNTPRKKDTPSTPPAEWNTKQIAKSIITTITAKLEVDERELTREANYTRDLGADSLDTQEIAMELEKLFNIAIPYYDAEQIDTIGDTVTYIEYREKQPAPVVG